MRVFTIAYGKDAKKGVLQQIAEATQGRAFDGKPENIRQVFPGHLHVLLTTGWQPGSHER